MFYPVTPRLRNHGLLAAIALFLIANAPQMRADESITVRSGNGSIGSQDAQVRFLAYGTFGNITPTAQDFESAQTGTFAYVDAPYATYIQQLPTDPLAQWVGTTNALGGGSALYAIPFMVTDPVIAAASLNLGYAVDNAINGVYFNGMPISNNPLDGDYHGEYYVLRSDIAPLLVPNSINWLYINASDYGAIAGLIFSANITTQGGAPGAPTISPTQGGNTGQVSVRVIASGFQPDAQITLTGIGPIITGTNVTVVSPNILTATLDLTGAAPGVYTVTVTNPAEGTSTTLSNAFTVEGGGAANVQISKIGTPAVLARNQTYFITVSNLGTVDSGTIPVVEDIDPWFTLVTTNPTPSLVTQAPEPFPPGAGGEYNAFIEWDLPSIPAGRSQVLSYTVNLNSAFPASMTVVGPACIEIAKNTCEVLEEACFTAAVGGCIAQPEACVELIEACHPAFAACLLAAGAICAYYESPVRSSVDPNDLVGPPGFGVPMWIAGPKQIQYTLAFNNLPTATKPATNVYVTDTFDPSTLDLTTLVVNAVTFGSTNYALPNIPLASQTFSQDIDLRPALDLLVRVTGALNLSTNQVTVSFLSLDPATGMTPTNPLAGFLAPGEGGAVLFTVNPKPGFTTGTAIQDSGAVVFDTNPPINTNVWSNSIDITPPVSHVVALPPTETTPLTVSWAGTDVGSGVQNYSVYVSDNGGAFSEWQTNSTATSATYSGTVGHSYGFYSIAQDNVGNVEPAKTAPDTTTQVVQGSGVITVSPTSLNFGSVHKNRRKKEVVTLENTGTTKVEIGAVSFTNISGSPADFSFHQYCNEPHGGELRVGDSCTIAVFFDADAVATDTATLNIMTSAAGSPLQVPITATGIK